ncbi:MAG: cell envelope integrity protein CreD [Betaproteobacteria bacterium]|jgi:inner membrane protein|nr:cell envelope integrity protein CreD [Betaproteobacteria bacterium]
MNRHLVLKTLAIGLLVLLLLVPLALIQGTIEERASYRMQVQQEVAATHAGAQVVAGPVLVLPYLETTTTVAQARRDGEPAISTRSEQRTVLVFPAELAVEGDVQVELRRRGIHQAPVWRAKALTFTGRFEAPAPPPAPPPSPGTTVTRVAGEPYVVFSVSDLRGFVATPSIELGGERVPFEPRAAPPFDGPAVRARVDPKLLAAGGAVAFTLHADLAGTRELSFVPLGDETRVALRSNWPHPSFGGRFLPLEREVGDAGFSARWSVPAIATQARASLAAGREAQGERARTPAPAVMDGFGVRLIDPVDIYAQATRATKYGVLFVVLTFGAFWLFEALRRVPIHPVQYGFVGAALAIFFLLLLALSEHLPFGVAYGLAATACILLIGVYLSAVLGGPRLAAGFCAGLAGLHGALYSVIRLEDTALLVGTLLLFSALACAMLASRRIDWTRFGLAPVQPGG